MTSGFEEHTWGEEASFRFEGDDFLLSGMLVTRDEPLFRCHPCAPGTAVDASSTFSPGTYLGHFIGDGSAAIGGQSWPFVFFGGNARFTAGSVTAPAGPGSLSTPFSFSGQISGFASDAGGPPLFTTDLSGRGTATLTFRIADLGGVEVDNVIYAFEATDPVPEPGTMALLGSGLAAIAAARRRRANSRI